jgi:hypothetical protein
VATIMSRRHRELKIKMWEKDPYCHWCGCFTVVTNIVAVPRGTSLPDNAATVDHVYSRFNARRWVKAKYGERRRVLACYKCNHERAEQEENAMTLDERLDRGLEFAKIPRGQAFIEKPMDTIEDVIAFFKTKGVDISPKRDTVTT